MAGFLSSTAAEQAPVVRPRPQIGLGLDIVHGEMARGMKGDIIINGGIPNLAGGTGIGNVGKTALALAIWAIVSHRYKNSSSRIFDSELTLTLSRMQNVWMHHGAEFGVTLDDWLDFEADIGRFNFSDRTNISCSDHHNSIRKAVKERVADKKALTDTPFRDRNGQPMKYYDPHIEINDSFSAYTPDQVENTRDKNEAGDSGRNMEAMSNARIKTQMLSELLVDTAKGGVYYYMTAHLGEQHALDPYKPPKEKLAALKNGLKMKDVPEKITFYPSIFWWGYSAKPLLDANGKPFFPDPDNDYQNEKKSVDLQEVLLIPLRNKSGPAGDFKSLIMSQTRGIIDSLTNFWNCSQHNRFGIMGKDQNPNNLIHFYMELYPNCPLTRQKIESKAAEDKRLHNAITHTSMMLDVFKYWSHIPNHWKCTPAELYKDLKDKGYDWDELLDCRTYWTYDHYTNPVHAISIIDLLRMRVGEYHPWWMGELTDAPTETSKAA